MIDGESAAAPKSEKRRPTTAEEVAPGILRLMLPIDLPGLGHVNCYALPDKRGLALVDPGMADGVTFETLRERLDEVNLAAEQVHTIVVTHSHFDHFGGIARLRAAEMAPEVVAHDAFGQNWREAYGQLFESEDSSELVERSESDIDELASTLVRSAPWGGTTDPFPPSILRAWGEGIDVMDVFRPPAVSHGVSHDDSIMLGDQQWRVIHTPGHADDHICLWNADRGVLFSGDHVLPTITPHISGFSDLENPLGAFFASLERVGELDGATLVLPAHGDPFSDLTGRANAIHQHHLGRLERVREIGREIGEQSVDAYMQVLFRERSWGSMAASETYAHLEWLRKNGEASREEVSGWLRYKI